MAPHLDIIIVNWNSGAHLRNCLESLTGMKRDGFILDQLVVVDNGSTDGSMSRLDDLGLPFRIISNDENRGFGAACNQGAADSTADYLLFLNPDTSLFPDSLARPVAFMEQPEGSRIGITGIQLLNDRGEVTRSCAHFPSLGRYFVLMLGLNHIFPGSFGGHFMTEWDHGDSREVEHVMGAFFLTRRSLFEDLQGFDERFFVYVEDLDFSLRAARAGWPSYYLADARASHTGGGASRQVKAARLFYSLRSRILYGFKHFSTPSAALLMLGTLTIEPLSRIALAMLHRSAREIVETTQGYAMLMRWLPSILTDR